MEENKGSSSVELEEDLDEDEALDEDEDFDEIYVDRAYMLLSIPLRLLILLGGTIVMSVLYKALVETGIFKLIHGTSAHRLIYCAAELAVLGVFWHGVFIFSKKCRHRSDSLGAYYFMSAVVAAAYAGSCYGLFRYLSRDVFTWVMRISLNLCGLRFRTTFPRELGPYLIGFVIVTILIMMLEPKIAKLRYKQYVRRMKEIPGPMEAMIGELRDRSRERRHIRHKRRRKRRHMRRMRRQQRDEALETKRMIRWKARQKKLRARNRRQRERKQAAMNNRNR